MAEDRTDEILFPRASDEYGDRYRADYVDIYKLYVASVDSISARRQTANSFFVTLNTAVLAFLGYVKPSLGQPIGRVTILVVLAGIVICYTWYRLIQSYRGLNSAKFRVIRAIEKNLPLAPYDAEWEAVGRGKDPKRYMPFTHIEVYVPWVFMSLYVIGALLLLPWREVCNAFGGTP